MDFSVLFSQTKTAVNIVKLIIDSSDTLDKSEQKLKFSELLLALADIKSETAEIKSLILEKDEKILALEKQLKLNNDLIYEAPYYWMKNENYEKEGPFCQQCYDANKQLIRLQFRSNDIWDCHNCKGVFKGKEHTPPKQRKRTNYNKSWSI